MYTLLLIVQVAVAIALIVLILLQHGKGADAGAAFGSGASATVFGSRGAGSFLSRTTGILATLFFANSLLLSTPLILGDRKAPTSVTEKVQAPATPTDSSAPSDLPDAPSLPMQSAPSDLPEAPAPMDQPETAEDQPKQ
ncbi:MAG: preprotein translocase subunit SecG [Gammaproteobacteria bacterium]|nr:preprotein translocase subunit SecG [Gammaproteobacteria bacterium]MBU2479146.1 preprotein translocase subunit SecG [Gammaproteobacteria bacterium]